MSDSNKEFDDYDEQRAAALSGLEDESEAEEVAETNKNLTSFSDGGHLGHVITSNELRVTRTDEQFVYAYVYETNRDDLTLGDYVELPYPPQSTRNQEALFGVVSEMSYEQRTEVDDRQDRRSGVMKDESIDERRYVLVARISPLAIVYEDGTNLKARSVNRVPKPYTYLYRAESEEVLRAGLGIPEHGPFLGHMAVGGERRPRGRPLPFKVPNPLTKEEGEPAIFRHGLIAGSTGKGKTHFAKNFVRQYINDDEYEIRVVENERGETTRKPLNVVVFDPNNEYSEMGQDNPDFGLDDPLPLMEEENEMTFGDLKKQGVQVGGVNSTNNGTNDLRVYVPEVANSVPPTVKDSYDFSIPFTVVKGRPQLLMSFEAPGPTRAAISASLRHFFSEHHDGHNNGTYAAFKRMLEHGKTHLKQTANDSDDIHPPGMWVEQYDISRNVMTAMTSRLIRPHFTDVFDSGSNDIPDITNEMFRPGRVTVIPTSHLTGPKEKLVVMIVLATIIENKLSDFNVDKNIKNTPMFIVMDEAHNYLSEPSPSNTQEQYIVGKYRDAAKQGRKYGLGLLNITQDPSDIDPEILKQTNTRIYLGLEPDVIENVKIPGGFAHDIINFGKGQAVVKVPDVRAVEIQGLTECVTKHLN